MGIAARGRWMVGVLALLSACGGGSGGGVGEDLTDADFVGTYFVVRAGGTGTAGATNVAAGVLEADGGGSANLSIFVNDEGTAAGPATFGFLYDVAADGTLDFRSGGDPFESGGLAADGAGALLASLSRGSPRVLVLLKKGGAHSAASLSGAYHLAGLIGLLDGSTSAFGGPATFDGTGDGTFDDVTINEMGSVNTEDSTCSYNVETDGGSSLAIGAARFLGGVVEGGAAALWGGSITSASPPALFAVVRATAGADNATFSGEYWVVRFARELATSQFVAQVGTATANGAGLVTYRLATNRDGTVTPEAALPSGDAYTVAPDGALTFLGTHPLRGGISADGRFAVLGGGTASDDDPAIMVLRHK